MNNAFIVFVLASLIRLASNMYYVGIPERAWAYWYGRGIFEILAIVSVLLIFKGIPRAIIAFFLGLAVYNTIKELFCPTCLDWNEYVGLGIGSLLFIAQIVRNAKDKRKIRNE